MRGLHEVAANFHEACREADVAYCFVGALAVMAWGEPRATTDADALVRLTTERVPSFVEALERRGLSVVAQDVLDALSDGSHLTIFAEGSPFYVDAKPARRPEEVEEIARAVTIDLPSGPLRVVPAEETIAFKLLFGSPKDLQDALSILVRQEDVLDRRRLEALAARLGVADRLRSLERQRHGKA